MNGQQAFFDALLDPERPPPPGLTAWNGSDAGARFAVYRNNVVASLIDALADTFPVAQELVGEAFFRAMARLFVEQAPPRSPVLAFYGDALPAFIEDFPPAASVPYLADVARLELMRVRAYHAADAAELPAEAIAQALADPDGLPDLRVGLHPSVGLVRSPYAVASLWAAHQGIGDIAAVDPCVPEEALVVRAGLDVAVIRLAPGTGAFVAHLLQGESLGSAAERAGRDRPDFDLGGTLGLLIRNHALSSMNTSRRTHP